MNLDKDQVTEELAPGTAPETPEAVEPAAEIDPWEQLETEVAKWKDAAMRTAADLDNFRKRAAREREEAVRYANQRLLEELLPVIDNFEMGMQAASKEQGSMIYIGMDMVRRQLSDFLSSQGAEEIPSEGKDFDPNVHEAVQQEETTDAPEGRVLRVIRRGFRLRDRLLRPASVVVSKAPATAEKED
ncbi:MAG TPA: nucleotide exchange factor GrpE [Luteolibacter sp.]